MMIHADLIEILANKYDTHDIRTITDLTLFTVCNRAGKLVNFEDRDDKVVEDYEVANMTIRFVFFKDIDFGVRMSRVIAME